MKKIKHILVCGLAVVASAVAVQAQTLTQDWKMTEGLPAATDARWGVGFDGKVFVNDMTAQKIASFDGTNKNTLEVGAAGVCTSVDSKGNLLVANLWKWGGKMTSLKIWNKATGAISEIEVTIPKGVTSTNRMDVFGKVVGDITSETGGAVFFCPSNGNKIVKLFFANSVQVVEKSKVIETAFANFQTTCIAQPLTNDPESDAIILKDKGVKEVYVFDGTNWTTLENAGVNGSTGIDAVTLNGTQYTIEPTGIDFADGFQIVDRSTNTVVATHAAEGSANGTSYGTSLNAEKVDEFTATIYQYHCGQFAAKYTFSLPKMYILGQNEVGDAWNPTSGIAMTWESGNVWSATVTTAPGRENLGFVSVLAENNDEGGWTYVNGNRWGLGEANQEGALAEKLTVSKNENSVNVGVGTFFIRMNLDDNTLYIAPTKLYVIGTSNKAEGHHWASDDDSYMAESNPETPGVFTFDPIDLKVEGKAVGEEAEEDLAYFAFVTGIDAEWGPVNNSRWCPDNKDGELTDNTDFTDFGKHYNGAFCIKNGAYKLTVDLNTKTVKAVYLTSSGVEQVGAEAAGVIAADGQIRIVGDAATVSVYNAAGQSVAINSAERTFAVARGMYVVVVDGKATKVVVR